MYILYTLYLLLLLICTYTVLTIVTNMYIYSTYYCYQGAGYFAVPEDPRLV